ncbi:MAG: cation diffusion facilitator family transporter [bacterium]
MNHDHSHTINNYNRSFAIGIILNITFVVIEGGYGILSDSLALIADAGHNLSDVASLLLAWGASLLARRAATQRRTYGYRKVTVLASLVSAILLLVVLGGITWEAIGRFINPKPVESLTIITVAGIGVIINTLTALLFVKGQKHDLNIRGAFLHMAADAGVSLAVVIAGIFISIGGWLWIDPVVSLLIVTVIFFSMWGLLRDSINYIIDAVPRGIDYDGIRRYLMSFDCVIRIHDLHIWPLSTTEVALTVHIVVNDDSLDNEFLLKIQRHLHDNFNIEHATVQVESCEGEDECILDRDRCK